MERLGYVHVSKAQILALKRERHEIDRIGVWEALERDAYSFGSRAGGEAKAANRAAAMARH